MRISSGISARSWNSRIPNTRLPCSVSSSRLSASILLTNAVEDMATAPPMTIAPRQSTPPGTTCSTQAAGIASSASTISAIVLAHLGRAEAEHVCAKGCQLGHAEFQPEREHQEDDTELGECPDHLRVTRHVARVGPEQRADRQVTDQRGQADPPQQRHHEDTGAQQDQRQFERVHGCGSSGTGSESMQSGACPAWRSRRIRERRQA